VYVVGSAAADTISSNHATLERGMCAGPLKLWRVPPGAR
jgi:hypothetical protein